MSKDYQELVTALEHGTVQPWARTVAPEDAPGTGQNVCTACLLLKAKLRHLKMPAHTHGRK